MSKIDYDERIESLVVVNEAESLLVDNVCYKANSEYTSINSNLGEWFQQNSCASHFKISKHSNNPLSKNYLDNASIITYNVEAITTTSDAKSGSLDEVDDLTIENLIKDPETTLNQVIVSSIHSRATCVVL